MIEIVPAIDLIDGKCVRLTQGDYHQKKVYSDNPLEIAKKFEGVGIKRLHLVDLDGAKAQHIVNQKVLQEITSKTSLIVDFGGGLKTDEDLKIAFDSGAAQITGGSIAVKNQEKFISWIQTYGADKIILGADAKNRKIAVSGWQEVTERGILEFIEFYIGKGIKHIISTDVAKDGLLEGPSFELYQDIMNQNPDCYLIASGGVSKMQDIIDLDKMGVPAVIMGKAYYENRISLKDIEAYYAH